MPPLFPRQPGPYRVRQNDRLVLQYVASAAPTDLRARIHIEYDNGGFDDLELDVTTFTTDRTRISEPGTNTASPGKIVLGPGTITDAILTGIATGLKRGQFYANLAIKRSTYDLDLCRDYYYDGFPISLGTFVESGPGGGEGFLSWVALAADIAPVAITHAMAATNAFRRVYGFAMYYNASGDAATRVMVASVRQLGLALPTGFGTAANALIFSTGTVSLIVSQEGSIVVTSTGRATKVALNTNGTLTGSTVNDTPFPLDIVESDLGDIFFDLSGAHANDRWSVYVLREEWLKV